jgi:hypothetical protein
VTLPQTFCCFFRWLPSSQRRRRRSPSAAFDLRVRGWPRAGSASFFRDPRRRPINDALTPEAVEQVILLTECDDQREREVALQREQKDITKRIARLVAAIESGGDAKSISARLRELEARQTTLHVEAASLQPVPRLAPAVIENRLAEWRRLLRQSTTQGRAVLQRVLSGRITFTPVGEGYDFAAPTRFDKLFTGIAAPPAPAWLQADGMAGKDGIGPEDTHDGDYGRLLERASQRICGKGVASPAGTSMPSVVRSRVAA